MSAQPREDERRKAEQHGHRDVVIASFLAAAPERDNQNRNEAGEAGDSKFAGNLGEIVVGVLPLVIEEQLGRREVSGPQEVLSNPKSKYRLSHEHAPGRSEE